MTDQTEDNRRLLSRRELLKHVIIGVAVVVPRGQSALAQEATLTLTPAEATTLEAIVARLIPKDENGPGAVEAGAVHYIDRALGDALALASSRDAYASGLRALDAYAQSGQIDVDALLAEPVIDQSQLFNDNSVLRGQEPRVDEAVPN